jgi:predicted outer membrane repeat protein
MTVAAPAGGAISTNKTVTVDLRDVTIQDNQVVGPFGQGGAIFVNQFGMLRAVGMRTMRNNSAEFGGAFAMYDAEVSVQNSSITNNTAMQYDGGAIYAVSTGNATLRVEGSTLANNR